MGQKGEWNGAEGGGEWEQNGMERKGEWNGAEGGVEWERRENGKVSE